MTDDDLTTRARELAHELITAFARVERKRALEEAERVCREYAAESHDEGRWAREGSATECADRIAGLEREE